MFRHYCTCRRNIILIIMIILVADNKNWPWGSCIIPTVNPAMTSLGRSVLILYFLYILRKGNTFSIHFLLLEHFTRFPAVFLHFSGNVRTGSSFRYSFRNAEVWYGVTSSLLEYFFSVLDNWLGGMSPRFILKVLIWAFVYKWAVGTKWSIWKKR